MMRYLGPALQLMLFALFVAAYIAVIIPAALIAAIRAPIIRPAPPKAKTTIGYGNRRIY
jgi:hypothetical protein